MHYFLLPVATNLTVTVFLCGSVGEVKPFQNDILSVFAPKVQYSFLLASLLITFLYFLLLPSVDFLYVIEYSQLPYSRFSGNFHLRDKMIDRQSEPSYKQPGIYDAVEKSRPPVP